MPCLFIYLFFEFLNHLLPRPRSLLLKPSDDGRNRHADISPVSMDTGDRGHRRQPPEAGSSEVLERHEFHGTKSLRHNAPGHAGGGGVRPGGEPDRARHRQSAGREHQ